MTELTRIDCADWLLDRDKFVILTHRKPDGDTVGSAAGLCRGLRSIGKTAHILVNPEFTPLYAPLVEGLTKEEPEEGDIIVLTSKLTGFEGVEYDVQWQYNEGLGWNDVAGATEETYSYTADEENVSYEWRLVVNVE